jgi:type VI secretion system secreted protein VgrG
VVQYEESDWDFLQRWLEHEGLYTWFEHGGPTDTLLVGDSAGDATPIADSSAPRGASALRYRSANNLDAGDEASLWDWEVEQRRIPARVAVFDYNYRTPHVRLVAKGSADEKTGFGTVMRYGDHAKSPTEAAAIAKLRAERLACERRVYSGRTDCARFRAGHWFSLADHDEPDHNRKYLITRPRADMRTDSAPSRSTCSFARRCRRPGRASTASCTATWPPTPAASSPRSTTKGATR